jgi:DNA polymerase III epsilon subunit-like protein
MHKTNNYSLIQTTNLNKMFAKFHEYNVHSMETRFKTQIAELFNQHAMRTRTKSLQLEQMCLSDLDTMFVLPSTKVKAVSNCVLVFDTETTGLINKSLLPLQYKDLALHPYITQLSAVLYDVDNQKVKKVFNTYVKIPDHVEIPEIVQQLTGITKEKCDSGMEIGEALNAFYQLYLKCDAIVAHNMWFDSKMIRIECMRNRFPQMLGIFYQNENGAEKPISCTMMEGMRYCGLNRFVRLSVLYEILFKEDANQYELHNSLVDTMVCLRCYLKIFCEKEISNEVFERMIQ